MKLMHIADLHIGKRLHEVSLTEDQEYILSTIVSAVEEQRPDALIIAGDVYDKSVPAAESSGVLSDFLTAVARLGVPVCMISGNHDSGERLDFASDLLRYSNVHISGVLTKELHHVDVSNGEVHVRIWLLPFIKPSIVRAVYGEEAEDIHTYDAAVRFVLSRIHLEHGYRHVLVAHQFVTSGGSGPMTSDSELLAAGGVDNVDAGAFDGFDYIALGHIHGPQPIGRPAVRYAGSPLKYSFSEARHVKSITMIGFDATDGAPVISMVPLQPLRELREVRGPLSEILKAGREEKAGRNDYIRAVLTDEEDQMDAMVRLREVYPNTLALLYDNTRSRSETSAQFAATEVLKLEPLELFARFYEEQNGQALDLERRSMAEDCIEMSREEMR